MITPSQPLASTSTWSASDSTLSSLPFPIPADSAAGIDSILKNAHPVNPAFPAQQGLYDPENERDACGVGFVCHIKGKGTHKIVSDARNLLCNMTHRGASTSTIIISKLLKSQTVY